MEINKEDKVEKINKKDKTVLFLSFLLLLLLMVFFSLYYIFYIKTDALKGEIFMTLAPKDSEYANIYSLNLETMELQEYFEEANYSNYMGKFSPNLEKMVFVRNYEDETSQLMFVDETEEKEYEITGRSNYFPRNPSFSKDGDKVVYWVYENEEIPFSFGEFPEDHSIYISSLDGKLEKVAEGAFPLFCMEDSSTIIFLKNDGLYSLDLEGKLEQRFYDLDFSGVNDWLLENAEFGLGERPDFWGWLTFRYNISLDQEFLLVTEALPPSIRIYQRQEDGWGPGSLLFLQDVEGKGPVWPVYSPRGEHYAVQDFGDWEGISTQLQVYQQESSEKVFEYGLNDFNRDHIFITDWIVR